MSLECYQKLQNRENLEQFRNKSYLAKVPRLSNAWRQMHQRTRRHLLPCCSSTGASCLYYRKKKKKKKAIFS